MSMPLLLVLWLAALFPSVAAAQLAQTITFAALANKTYGAAAVTLSATASSGLPVSFASLTTTTCSVSGTTATIVAPGTCTIRASQAGNTTYAAAPNVDRSFTIAKAAQTITFGALSAKTYGNPPFTVSATASSGLAVTFVSLTTAVCTVSGNTVTLVGGGTCTLQAQQPGNANYLAAANVNQGFAVAKLTQTIAFGTLAAKTYGNPPFTVSATASSGLAVTFVSLTTAVCTVSGNTVTLIAGGTCTIQAQQAGNTIYAAAPNVNQGFTVAKLAQTITFGALAAKTYGDPAFTVSATASSGLTVAFVSLTATICTVSATTVTIVAGGTCTIQAQQAGNTIYAAAPNVNQSFAVAKLAQTITFGALAAKTYGDPPFTVSATASSGLTVTFASLTTTVCTVSGSTVTIIAGGTCTIQAQQAGNTIYAAAPAVNQSFAIAKAAQTIAFGALTNRTLGAAPFTVSATASSGLTVGFSSVTTSICTVSGTTVTLVAAGTCTIRAAQAGNANYVAAPNVDQSFTITAGQAGQTITFPTIASQFAGAAASPLWATASSGLAVSYASQTPSICSVSGNRLSALATGTCTVRASQPGNANYTAATNVDQTTTITSTSGASLFALPVNYAVGVYPDAVAVADFNGDGKPDIATANWSYGTVSILLGQGDGTFAPGNTYEVGRGPMAIVAADFNGDGKIDLATANLFTQDVSILLGNGNGTFAPASAVTVGGALFGIAAGDLNGDGKLDLAVTHGTSNGVPGAEVIVLFGSGTGTFQIGGRLATGANPQGVAIRDLNGDGKQDLVVTNGDSNTVSVLLGAGNGSFFAHVDYATDWYPYSVAVGDVNGDGKPDVVVTNAWSNTVSVLLGRGDGTLQPALWNFVGAAPSAVVIGDFNGDGKPDLAVMNELDNSVSILTGNGDGTFAPAQTYGVLVQPMAMASADLNGDGRPDLVVAASGSDAVSVLLRAGAAGVPASLSVNAGDGRSATINTAYTTPLSVLVRDGLGQPVSNVAVTFTAPSTGASGTFSGGVRTMSANTGSNGIATAPTFTANGSVGAFSVSAAADTLSTSFALTNTASTTSAPAFTSGPPPGGVYNQAYSYTLTASGVPAPTFSAVPGTLPPGLSLNATSGVLGGTPTTTGTYAGTLTATNGVPPDATQSFAIIIASATQTITFSALPAKTYGDAPFAVSAIASSGLSVSFVSLTTATCTVSGSTVTIVAAGTCTIQAQQAGNSVYGPAASVNQSTTIAKVAQTISFAALGNRASGSAPFTVSATASSGLAVTFSSQTNAVCTVAGSTVTLVATGACTIRAAQAGNGNYNAAPNIDQSFTVTSSTTAPGFSSAAPPNGTYNQPYSYTVMASGTPAPTFAVSSGALPPGLSLNTSSGVLAGTPSGAGAYSGTLSASNGVTPNATQSFTISIAQASQTITFATISSKSYGEMPFTISASASSGLTVTFVSLTTGVCNVSGSTVTLISAGTCTIQAQQGGNTNYAAAAIVKQTFLVAALSQTITFAAIA
ncbi:MAG TPA: FG-GAP-like repeat-containing protein, partial [Casimicrobiaceae bacterium]|nr:FG-GAP-like repeat-containing protein [Casimicrobiaceae bacterium]